MFRSALIKLTLIYLTIIMAISLFFSLMVYSLATREINFNLTRQQNMLERRPPFRGIFDDPEILLEREMQLNEGRRRIIFGLLNTNLAILVAAGGASYFLAKRTLKPLEKAHESQSRFSSDASHELRSPLAAMRAEIEVALREKNLTHDEAKKLLSSNLEELGKLTALSEGLLQLARDNGISQKPVSVSSFVDEAVGKAEKSAKDKKITITKDIEDVQVLGDKQSLVQLLGILLDNAVKYSSKGKKIEVTAKKHHKEVEIAVKDQGQGVRSTDLPHIFDRFFRADASRNKKVEGYGLGLSIAQKIVDLHHGKIEATSEPKKGSTFIVKLPIAA